MKSYGTLMKLWGWAQVNVIDSDMKVSVQTQVQTFTFLYGLQLAIEVLSQTDNLNSSHPRVELCAVDAQRNSKLSITVFLGSKPP